MQMYAFSCIKYVQLLIISIYIYIQSAYACKEVAKLDHYVSMATLNMDLLRFLDLALRSQLEE